MTVTHEDILKTAIPTATVNFPGGGACRPRHTGVIISTLTRTRLAQRGLLYGVKEIENPTDYEKAHQLDHLIGEFAGQVEEPFRRPVVRLAPHAHIGSRLDHLHGEADAIAGAAQRGLHHVADVEDATEEAG